MEKVSHQCLVDGCRLHPSFGLPGGSATTCSRHRGPGMENVVTKRCSFDGCRLHPSFGFPGYQEETCAAHHTPGMENVVTKRCGIEGCRKHPSFGFPGQRVERCGVHREEGMESAYSKRSPVHEMMAGLEESLRDAGFPARRRGKSAAFGTGTNVPVLVVPSKEVVVIVEAHNPHRAAAADLVDRARKSVAAAYTPRGASAVPTVLVRFDPKECGADAVVDMSVGLLEMAVLGTRLRKDAVWHLHYHSC